MAKNDEDGYVVPNEDRGGWDVLKEDHQRAPAHTRTQAEANRPCSLESRHRRTATMSQC